jgi:hypothetical protein
MDSQVVDRIYESCFAPDIWPKVLDEIGRIAGAPGASLFVSQGAALNWVASPEPRQRAEKIAREGWLLRGTIVGRLFALRHPGFLIDVEFFTPEELDREPIYRDLWRPMGVGWGMGTAIPMPTGENATFVLSRRTELGPSHRAAADRLDELRPHLARSVLISARLHLERARAAIPGPLLKHVSPISWEHINLTGIYSWQTEPTDPTSFRPLREEKSAPGQAA